MFKSALMTDLVDGRGRQNMPFRRLIPTEMRLKHSNGTANDTKITRTRVLCWPPSFQKCTPAPLPVIENTIFNGQMTSKSNADEQLTVRMIDKLLGWKFLSYTSNNLCSETPDPQQCTHFWGLHPDLGLCLVRQSDAQTTNTFVAKDITIHFYFHVIRKKTSCVL